MHPGIVLTEVMRNYSPMFRFIFNLIGLFFFKVSTSVHRLNSHSPDFSTVQSLAVAIQSPRTLPGPVDSERPSTCVHSPKFAGVEFELCGIFDLFIFFTTPKQLKSQNREAGLQSDNSSKEGMVNLMCLPQFNMCVCVRVCILVNVVLLGLA